MSNKVKVPGGAFYAGDGLTVDPVTRTVSAGGSQVVYNLSNAVFTETVDSNRAYYFVDPTTLTEILKSMNTGSPMPYIGFKAEKEFFANDGIDFGWGTSMNTIAVTVYGKYSKNSPMDTYIFDTFEHAKEYHDR